MCLCFEVIETLLTMEMVVGLFQICCAGKSHLRPDPTSLIKSPAAWINDQGTLGRWSRSMARGWIMITDSQIELAL